MRLRNWIVTLFAITVATGSPGTQRASAADERTPTLLVRLKSLDGLMADAKYFAGLAGQEEAFKQIEGLIPAFLGPKGLASTGLDPTKPWGLYAILELQIPDSPVVGMIPVADENAFIGSLNRLTGFAPNVQAKIEKGKDGVYTVTAPNPLGIQGYFEIADGYAYVTAGRETNKAAISKAKRLSAGRLLTPDANTVLGMTLRIDTIDDQFKQIALGQFENQVAAAKERKAPNETSAQTKLKSDIIDYAAGLVRSILSDARAVDFRISVDRQTDDVSVQLTMDARTGSPLAKEIESAGRRPNRFAAFGSAAAQGAVSVAVPEVLRGSLAGAIEEGFKQDQARQPDAAKRDVARKIYEALSSTIKAGEVELAGGLLGPNSAGKFTFAAGVKVIDADRIEKLIRRLVPQIPDESTRKLFAFDAETVEGVKVHRVAPKLDPEARRMLGDNATVLFAFPSGAVVIAGGAEPAAALKSMFVENKKTAGPLWAETSAAKFAEADAKNADRGKKAAAASFGGHDGSDTVRLQLDGGDALRLQLSLKGQVFKFAVMMGDRGK
jgi:hypothetical protein